VTSPRPDTRYLATATLTTDLSQRATNLTASGAAGYEDPSPRTALDGTGNGRSLEFTIEIDENHGGTLACHGRDIDADPAYEVRLDAGSIVLECDGSSVASLAVPNLGASVREYVVAVATEPNPSTTGAGDALRTEITIYDVTADEVAYATKTHAVYTVVTTGAFTVGGQWTGGALVDAFDGTITAVRVSARFHTKTETREHFVAATAAPDPDGIEAVEVQVLPSQVTEPGAIVGPQYQAAAHAMAIGRNRHRSVGPVIQMVTPSAPVFGAALSTTVPAWWVRSLGDGYSTHLGWYWRRKIPRHTDWLRTVVQWATWYTSGTLVSVKLRLYTSDEPPHLAQDWDSVTLSRTTHDTVGGLGVLEDFALVRVRRNAQGLTHVWLGAQIDVGGGNTNAFVVRALTATPVSRPAVDGQAPNQWGP
jgi:hypothetical protein